MANICPKCGSKLFLGNRGEAYKLVCVKGCEFESKYYTPEMLFNELAAANQRIESMTAANHILEDERNQAEARVGDVLLYATRFAIPQGDGSVVELCRRPTDGVWILNVQCPPRPAFGYPDIVTCLQMHVTGNLGPQATEGVANFDTAMDAYEAYRKWRQRIFNTEATDFSRIPVGEEVPL